MVGGIWASCVCAEQLFECAAKPLNSRTDFPAHAVSYEIIL